MLNVKIRKLIVRSLLVRLSILNIVACKNQRNHKFSLIELITNRLQSIGYKDRLDTKILSKGKKGFILGFRTWGDSRVIGAGINWMAIGNTNASPINIPDFPESKYSDLSNLNADSDDIENFGDWEQPEEPDDFIPLNNK